LPWKKGQDNENDGLRPLFVKKAISSYIGIAFFILIPQPLNYVRKIHQEIKIYIINIISGQKYNKCIADS